MKVQIDLGKIDLGKTDLSTAAYIKQLEKSDSPENIALVNSYKEFMKLYKVAMYLVNKKINKQEARKRMDKLEQALNKKPVVDKRNPLNLKVKRKAGK